MSSRTSLGIRYPGLDDGDIPTSLSETMTDIDALLASLSALYEDARRRDGAMVTHLGASTALPNGVITTMTYNTENYDDNGYVDLAVNNTRINLTSGVWLVMANCVFGGVGRPVSASVRVMAQFQGIITENQHGQFGTSTTSSASCFGVIATTGEYIYGQCSRWDSGGAAGTYGWRRLQAFRIRDYY